MSMLGSRRLRDGLLLLAVVLALLLPRLLELDHFVTVDEPRWLMRSGNFYQALAGGDFRNTFQREHPGVTTTWAGMAGFLWRFPGYYKVGSGELIDTLEFHRVLETYQKEPLSILAAGRTFIVLAIVTVLCLAFLYTRRLFALLPALLAFAVIAFDPFFIAHSRLLHLDGLLTALMFLSILAFLSYLHCGRSRVDLVISALAAGLGFLTKSPALFLIPFVFLLVLLDLLMAHSDNGKLRLEVRLTRIPGALFPLLLWLVLAVVVVFLLWPAMWVDPLGSLARMVSQSLVYTAEGHAHGYFFNGEIYGSNDLPWYFYPVTYSWRTTPINLIGIVLTGLSFIFRRRLNLPLTQYRGIGILTLYALLFTVFVSISAKKFDRYLLPVFLPLDLIAGFGWYTVLVSARRRLSTTMSAVLAALAGIFLLAHFAGAMRTFPYYLNYYNPWLGGDRRAASVMMVGWGEGLDEAARYINSVTRNPQMRALSWYGDGCFSYFYDGVTDPINFDMSNYDLQDFDRRVYNPRKAKYVVFYLSQVQRRMPNPLITDYYSQFTPEYVVRIGNLDYAWVYAVPDAAPREDPEQVYLGGTHP